MPQKRETTTKDTWKCLEVMDACGPWPGGVPASTLINMRVFNVCIFLYINFFKLLVLYWSIAD